MASYRTTVYVGTVGGKKRRKTVTARTRRELDRKVMELKLEVARGKDCYTRATFDQWADKWMTEVVLPKGVSRGTVTKYNSAIKHMDRIFHGVRLRDIRLSDMQQLINELALENPNTGAPTSRATLVNIKKVGNSIFRYARQNNIEGVPNFFDVLQIPTHAPVQKRRALTSEEIDAVLNTPHWAQPMAMVMLFCGLRQGECVPLTWEDVDFEKRVLWVLRSADLQGNAAVVKEGGKTQAAKRIVPMPDVLVDYLLWYRKAQEDGTYAALCGARQLAEDLGLDGAIDPGLGFAALTMQPLPSPSKSYFAVHPTPSYKRPPYGGIRTPLLFTNLQGEMHTKASLRRLWEDYMRELNVVQDLRASEPSSEQLVLMDFAKKPSPVPVREPIHFTAHNLRHTYATMLFLQGVDVRDAMQYMGHTTYQVTLDIYTDTEQYCRFDIEEGLAERLKTDFRIPKPEW